jgi:eukaryotic-like serine/threonine-protein kinase
MVFLPACDTMFYARFLAAACVRRHNDNMNSIGKYKVIRKLGKGATGAVYLASDPFTNREVAIKVMFPDALQDVEDGAHYRQMFLNEASLAGKVIHPHVVAIYDAVVDEKMSYIVMEYVEGGTLEKFVDPNNLLAPQAVAEIIFKCIRALAFAYAEGLIHRDIKPGNLLFKGGTDVKICDFGAAVQVASHKTMSMSIGSPLYMAPEMIRGAKASAQTDIYALGMVMYMLLAGRAPYEATNPASLAYQIVNLDPEPPSRFREGISAPMEDVVKQAIAKDPAKRYQSWEEFAKDLSDVWQSADSPKADSGDVSDTERFNFLKRLAFFREFPENELWEVVRISKWRAFAADTPIIKEGDKGDSFFVIAQGNVKVTRGKKLLNVLGTGDCIGEMSYLSKAPGARSASVTTSSECIVMKIPAADLNAASENCRRYFDRRFLETLVERLNTANEQLAVS